MLRLSILRKGKMMLTNGKSPASRYRAPSIGLHWLMLLLFVAVYGSIELR